MLSNAGYHEFIKEAFIKPIRSVLIVDDDYPTYSEILLRQKLYLEGKEKASVKMWLKNPDKVKKVIESFRRKDRPLLVDIHDGGDGTEEDIAFHLHQSDLLVLDFQLDGANGDGTKAIEITRNVMANNHFNLVVIHTNADLDTAFREILLGLMSRCPDRPEGDIAQGRERVEQAELQKDILRRLHDSFSVEQYFYFRKQKRFDIRPVIRGDQPFAAFRAICEEFEWEGQAIRQVLQWAIADFEDRYTKQMHSSGSYQQLQWSEVDKWIRSPSAFIAFTNKTDEEIDMFDVLWRSLIAWSPKPSRLFLTKLRSELEEFGVAAEDAAVGNDFVLARWYKDLLDGDDSKRRGLIGISVARHAEQLLDYVQPKVQDFVKRLVEEDAKGPLIGTALVKNHFNVDLDDPDSRSKAERDHNIFACSKKAQGWHLETGHVFFDDHSYWVCLSPACDLVPGQKGSGHFKDVADHIPFFAVKLRLLPEGRPPINVHSNRYIFMDVAGGKKTFCINDPDHPNSAPHWFPLYAAKQGILGEQNEFEFSRLEMRAGSLTAQTHKAQIVGQLRYEYAINLVQVLGATFTRIGLDFLGVDEIG